MHEVTVCIPTFNGSDTIQKCLKSVQIQGVNARIIVMDNGSTDGTLEMLQSAVKNGWYGNHDIEVHAGGRVPGGRPENIKHVRSKLAELVETKFVLWLDDDIKLPPFALKLMMEMADVMPKLGCVGLHYQPFNGHMAVGATLMQAGVAKQLTWDYKPGQPCECNQAIEDIKKLGYEVQYMNKITALDLDYV